MRLGVRHLLYLAIHRDDTITISRMQRSHVIVMRRCTLYIPPRARFTSRPEGKHLPTLRACVCAYSSLASNPQTCSAWLECETPTDITLGVTEECENPTDIALGVTEARKPSHHFKVYAPGNGELIDKALFQYTGENGRISQCCFIFKMMHASGFS